MNEPVPTYEEAMFILSRYINSFTPKSGESQEARVDRIAEAQGNLEAVIQKLARAAGSR